MSTAWLLIVQASTCPISALSTHPASALRGTSLPLSFPTSASYTVLPLTLHPRVEIIGAENLPPADQACVYVANHQSFLDIYTLFHLHRPFKFISKVSNFLIPCIGWSMYLTGHVPLQRLDRRSQMVRALFRRLRGARW